MIFLLNPNLSFFLKQPEFKKDFTQFMKPDYNIVYLIVIN